MTSRGILRRRVLKLVRAATHPVYLRGLLRGVLPAANLEPALRLTRPDVIVDAGAHRGQFSLVARRMFPKARIIAFEPLADTADTTRSLFRRDPRFELHEVALGATDGVAELLVAQDTDSSSLLPATPRLTSEFAEAKAVGHRPVPLRRLGSVIDASSLDGRCLLKLDVQGFELEVLRGASDLLARFEWILCEASYQELYQGQPLAEDIQRFLEQHGFALVDRFTVRTDREGREFQADLLFRRVKRVGPESER